MILEAIARRFGPRKQPGAVAGAPAWSRGPAPAGSAGEYGDWIEAYDALTDGDRAVLRERAARLSRRPLISIVMPIYETDPDQLREALRSVLGQIYDQWQLVAVDDASPSGGPLRVLQEFERDPRITVVRLDRNRGIAGATNAGIDAAEGEYVGFLDHDDLLSERTLYEMAVELNTYPGADILYSDEDRLEDGRRTEPYFKSDWNPDLMLGHNMTNHFSIYRTKLIRSIAGLREGFSGSQDYDLMLRVSERTTPARIRHVPSILYHWRKSATQFSETQAQACADAARRAIAEHLDRTGAKGEVGAHPIVRSWHRVTYALPEPPPLVSVIVPTRDRLDLLERCVDGVLGGTDYPSIELIIADNDSAEPETLDYLRALEAGGRARVLRCPGPFNYSAINNYAVCEARGEVVVLLNNDCEAVDGSWLREMVSHALRPEVGAVGAKLLHDDGTVQHAGVVTGIRQGVADHFHIGIGGEDIGYFGRAALVQQMSAVTAACIAMRRDVFMDVGGFDAENLPIAFNDVDLCLRIGAAGYRIVWTPHAVLTHLGSASRGSDLTPERAERAQREVRYMIDRWAHILYRDRFYNPNLSLDNTHFELAHPPRRNVMDLPTDLS